jgi:septal ring factor EnvC (AmiA/AmiB activator)
MSDAQGIWTTGAGPNSLEFSEIIARYEAQISALTADLAQARSYSIERITELKASHEAEIQEHVLRADSLRAELRRLEEEMGEANDQILDADRDLDNRETEIRALKGRIERARDWQRELVDSTNAALLAHGVCYCKECTGNIERQRASNEVAAILGES